ncbi:Rrf2 family transcriptional regulator [Sutcliffiella cohnii]|uniref:HTH-type transcriptional regulator NsrR n=1 Tax=Sutcliffiella cohnii TaxID=33932 RepID=A0A223KWM5_9BACI|nr:Rrf2 family transcriptional regulator [Sutcliffiella cohnii]AST93870.1 Rrf2 family transcriptional regulator [Sutcliffiella cohnii]
MQLTTYTDYALRVLIYLGIQPQDKRSNIKDISAFYHISNNHLGKVVHELGKLGIIDTVRGRNGGIKLAKHPSEINIGAIVRETEKPIHLVECFNSESNMCKISPACRLKGVLYEALQAYFKVLEQYTLEDLLQNKDQLKELLMK